MQVRMNIHLQLRVCNGFGDAVRNGMKRSLIESLVKQSNGAIRSELGPPGFRESFPNNGWTGFDYVIDAPIIVNVDALLKANVGRFAGLGKKLLGITGNGPIASKIRDQLDAAIRQNLAEADWTGLSASLEGCNVTLR
ncbi:hypothetical protein Pelo_12268 [Pelomyxa schiedti]|nr:hypothetical protein Pelo_12268 [Pelomyxa schiedti]